MYGCYGCYFRTPRPKITCQFTICQWWSHETNVDTAFVAVNSVLVGVKSIKKRCIIFHGEAAGTRLVASIHWIDLKIGVASYLGEALVYLHLSIIFCNTMVPLVFIWDIKDLLLSWGSDTIVTIIVKYDLLRSGIHEGTLQNLIPSVVTKCNHIYAVFMHENKGNIFIHVAKMKIRIVHSHQRQGRYGILYQI